MLFLIVILTITFYIFAVYKFNNKKPDPPVKDKIK